MPKVTIWVREEDYPYFKGIEDVPAWLHVAIQNSVELKARTGESLSEVEQVIDTDNGEEQEWAWAEDLIYQEATKKVWDVAAQEQVEADADLVKWLIKTGRTK